MRAEPTCEQYRDEPVSDVPVIMDDQSTTSAEQSAVMPQGRLNLGGITDMYIFALSHGRWLWAFFVFPKRQHRGTELSLSYQEEKRNI